MWQTSTKWKKKDFTKSNFQLRPVAPKLGGGAHCTERQIHFNFNILFISTTVGVFVLTSHLISFVQFCRNYRVSKSTTGKRVQEPKEGAL